MKKPSTLLIAVALLLFVLPRTLFAQQETQKKFTHADTLRGSITPERSWWNLLHYDLHVRPDLAARAISGWVTVRYAVLRNYPTMQIDLQVPLEIDSVQKHGKPLTYTRDGNAYFIHTGRAVPGAVDSVTVWYHGVPRAAKNAPWDGGIDWKADSLGNPWVSSACQGLGASVWWPNKDHQYDEPDDGASIWVTVPDTLMDVSNGRLYGVTDNPDDHTKTFHWVVRDPINNYDISINIGKYAHWSDTLHGEKGLLSLDFYVLAYNLGRARIHFAENVKPMLHCFEYWMGPYPFYEDGYKLIESHNLGMEHQSGVQYGNRFMNGYRGRDLSGTGWGLKWDFIIVHESGHEWFGNNITTKDLADMWVHEGFINYSETLYTTCQSGVAAGNAYCRGTRRLIRNDRPIIAHYNVNEEGSGDMYYKGGNMLGTIRCIIGNDEAFRQILRGLNKTFYHKTVTSAQVEAYITRKSGIDFSKTFDQYLRTTQIPVFTYSLTRRGENEAVLTYYWTHCVKGFNMPVRIDLPGGGTRVLKVTEKPKKTLVPVAVGEATTMPPGLVDPNIYVHVSQATG